MKALIGLDTHNDPAPIIDLFARLGFENCQVRLAHCLNAEMPVDEMPELQLVAKADPAALRTSPRALARHLEREAQEALDEGHSILYKNGIHSDEKLLNGHAATELMAEAEAMDADLVGIASYTRGHLKSAMLGSMGRALTIGSHKSLLIAKQPRRNPKPLTAVLATDHSDYCNKAIEKLIQFNPMGIQRLVILSVLPIDEYVAFQRWYELPPLEKGNQTHMDKLYKLCEKTARKFDDLHMEVWPVVREGYVSECIRDVMEEEDADLLIMAAQGHGFWERLGIGSVSLHEAVAAPYSVLILRLDRDESARHHETHGRNPN